MINLNAQPENALTSNNDFTVKHYRELVRLAKSNWQVAQYDRIPWGEKFVLWRHDVDYSLNRSLALALIEHEEGLQSTYFVNAHSEFYNLAELGQFQIIEKILSFGHRLGLHFDSAFHDVVEGEGLDSLVAREATYLSDMFGVAPVAFSFHNPTDSHLGCDAEYYGGLINCYSRRFKMEVPYCSDSNGYWRFRPLYKVLAEATDPCLQVLTHPGWWQDKPMPPRERVHRAVFGRAQFTIRWYDNAVSEFGRVNHAGLAESIKIFEKSQPRIFELCDYLWNMGHLHVLFVELWRLHEMQINKLCQAQLQKIWGVPIAEVDALFDDQLPKLDSGKLFMAIFGMAWVEIAKVDKADHSRWLNIRNQLINDQTYASRQLLEDGCIFLCKIIESLASWGQEQPVSFDGINRLDSISIPADKRSDVSLSDRLELNAVTKAPFFSKEWNKLKNKFQNITEGDTWP